MASSPPVNNRRPCSDSNEREPKRAAPPSGRADESLGHEVILLDADMGRHQSISMVEEPTKTLRGALAFFRGASCSIKSRDPIKI